MSNPLIPAPLPRAPWSVPRDAAGRLALLSDLQEGDPTASLTGKILTCVEGHLTEVAVTVALADAELEVTLTAWRLYCLGWLDEAPSLAQLAREIARELTEAGVCVSAEVQVKAAGVKATATEGERSRPRVPVDAQLTLLPGGDKNNG